MIYDFTLKSFFPKRCSDLKHIYMFVAVTTVQVVVMIEKARSGTEPPSNLCESQTLSNEFEENITEVRASKQTKTKQKGDFPVLGRFFGIFSKSCFLSGYGFIRYIYIYSYPPLQDLPTSTI